MNRRFLLAIALFGTLALSFLGSACSRHDPDDSSLPWGRPAAWEDRGPAGMGY